MKQPAGIIGSIRSQLAALAAMVALGAAATPTVTIVSAQQRYPWNGLVDVTYTLSGIEDDKSYGLRFEVTSPDGVTRVSDQVKDVTFRNGTRTATFNAASMLPETFAKGCSLKALLEIRNIPPDANGTAIGILGDVMIIDVSEGSKALSYPVTYYEDVDVGCFNCFAYKTRKIVLLKVPAGSYEVGENGNFNNPRRTMTTRGFYLGVFEVTQQQYLNVMGSNPSQYAYPDTFDYTYPPVESMSWNMLRDSVAPDATLTPDVSSDSFFRRLLARARDANGALTGFDLPTEGQWEIACRAGSTTTFFWGDDANEVNRYAYIANDILQHPRSVGEKQPNAWGFYDIAGNVWEMCRDANQMPWTITDADSVVSSGVVGTSRGGGYDSGVEGCRSGVRYGAHGPTSYGANTGFRLFKAQP